jgi:protein O-GlcNAc transferase
MDFAKALAAHQQGKFSEAEAVYTEILKTNPADFNSMHLLGVVALQTGRISQGIELIRSAIKINENVADAHSHLGNGLRDLNFFEEALASYDKAIALKPDHADAFNNRGIILWDLKRREEALASYDKAIALKPDYLEAYLNRGNALRDLHRPQEALASYDKVISLKPDNAEAYNSRGNALMDLRQFEEALASYEKAIELKPHFAGAHVNRGIALFELKRPEEAIANYDKAIALKPGQGEAHNNRGSAFRDLKRYEDALADYDTAIALNPGYFTAHYNRGNTMWDFGRPEEALASYDAAIALKPDHADAFNNRGIALWNLKRLAEALDSYDKSIMLNPDHAAAYNNRGAALLEMNRPTEALASFHKAIALKPDYADALRNSGNAWTVLRRFDEAFAAYDRLFRLDPDLIGVEGHRLNTKMHLCDWRDIESESAHLIQSVKGGFAATQPFFFLAVPSAPSDQLQCARLWTARNYPAAEKPLWQGERYRHGRIRVAYLSSDFRQHPASFLMAGMFECHDRSRFETTAISFGDDDGSQIRQRVKASFERFVDAKTYSDAEIADLVRSLEIDIAIDRNGFTTDARTGIFARRPAPVQAHYLGYPGTMGAPYIDYVIADEIVIPPGQRRFYSEKVAFLPNSYFVNDAKRPIAARTFTRVELGLPSAGFVFCCFNSNYKIAPPVFDAWMRILNKVEGSVLWLLQENAKAADNLRKEATARGVKPERLVFASRMQQADHLARHRVADLSLDTLPYNAHTTASDALWAGLPVLTCLGETFVGRVAASLLNAIGLPELITTTPADYERLAIDLATNPDRLAAIKGKLANNRLTTALFDTGLFTRHIEAAYTAMYARHQAGLAPNHIAISN